MNKKEDYNFEWLPGFREMMACQNDVQNNVQNNVMINNDNQMNNDNQRNNDSQMNSDNPMNNDEQNSTDANRGGLNTIQNKIGNKQNMTGLLPPEQLQQEEQQYWKDYEYLIQLLPLVAREVWIVADALLDQYEYAGSSIYSEYPDKVTILKIVDMVYDKLKYREQQEMMQADDETVIRNPYFVKESMRDSNTPFRTLIQVILHWNIDHRRQRYYRRQKVFSKY